MQTISFNLRTNAIKTIINKILIICSMKKLSFHPSYLQILYLIMYLVLFSAIIYIPTLISGPVHFTENFIVEEETIEGTLLGILFLISILILNLYKLEVSKHKEVIKKINEDKKKVESRLTDSYQYIGLLNVQIQEIKSIFTNVDKYPETMEDLKKTYNYLGERVHGIVNTNWVLFRIISNSTQRTISEHFEARHGVSFSFPRVSNKMIIEKQADFPYSLVVSNPQNLNIHVCCILPVEKISNDERVFIQAIINEITKLFVIMNSSFYKKEINSLVEDKPIMRLRQQHPII